MTTTYKMERQYYAHLDDVDGPETLTVNRVWIIYLRYIVDDLGAFGYVYFQGLCESYVQGVWHSYTGRISGNLHEVVFLSPRLL